MNRRHALRLLTASSIAVPTALIAGCTKKQVVQVTGYTGLYLGEVLVEFPQPVPKVIGVILIVGSKLILKLIGTSGAITDFSKDITTEQSNDLQNTHQIVLKCKDGSKESRKIDEERYA